MKIIIAALLPMGCLWTGLLVPWAHTGWLMDRVNAASPTEITPATSIPTQTHTHKTSTSILDQVRDSVAVVAVDTVPDYTLWQNMTPSADGRYLAFTAPLPLGESLFIRDMTSQVVYEVVGIPLPWRPFANLTWVEDVLSVDRWANPTSGAHYEIDMNQQQLIRADAWTISAP